MNKKIKQVIAIALALVMCAGALIYDPHPVMANDEVYGFWGCDEDAVYNTHAGGTSDCRKASYTFTDSTLTFSIKPGTTAVFAIPYFHYEDSSDSSSFHSGSHRIICPRVLFVSNSSFSIDWDATYIYDHGSDGASNSVQSYSAISEYNVNYGCYFYDRFLNAGGRYCDVGDSEFEFLGSYVDFEDRTWNLVPYVNYLLKNGSLDSDYASLVKNKASSTYERDTSLGALQNIDYRKIYTKKNGLADKLFYRFTWNRKTSTGVDLSLDGYDVLYYWECYSIEKTFTGKIKQSDSLFTDKKLVKGTQDNYYMILQNAYEGQLYDIYKKVYDTQPAITKDFDVITVLHVAPAYKDSIFAPIKYGLWSHVTFDNAGTARTIQETISDLDDGNGLEAGFDIETENEDGTSDTTHNKNTVGVGDDVDEAVNNSDHGNDTIFDSDFIDSFKDFDVSSLGGILNQLGEAASAFADLLGVVFGWMPSWVRASLIAAVCIWIFMLIKRAIF